MSFEHVGQVFKARQDTAELREVLHLHHEIDDRQRTIDIDTDVGDIDIFTIEQGRNIAHQPLPVESLYFDGHGVRVLDLAPIHLQEPFLVLDLQYVRTILPVDGCAASAGDVAHDLIARRRVATLGHLRKQAF